MLGDSISGETGKGMGLYWRIEKKVRELESASGSVAGATGALYCARRSLLDASPLPEGTILDDVLLPMQIVRQGSRVVFDSRARAWDSPDLGKGREFPRKVRTLTGNYQLLQLAPWLLSSQNTIRFEFISHKLSRLAVPFALLALLIASLFLPQPLYPAALVAQLAFYALSLAALAGVKLGPLSRIADPARTFVILNCAALVAFINFATGRTAATSARTTSCDICRRATNLRSTLTMQGRPTRTTSASYSGSCRGPWRSLPASANSLERLAASIIWPISALGHPMRSAASPTPKSRSSSAPGSASSASTSPFATSPIPPSTFPEGSASPACSSNTTWKAKSGAATPPPPAIRPRK